MAKGAIKAPEPRPPDPESMAQSVPRGTRSYDEMNTGTMVFELQGTVGKIEQAVVSLEKLVDRGFANVDKKLDQHSNSIRFIERTIWIVTGGAIVIGAIIGMIAGIGIDRIIAILGKFN
jgi:hypothetical protein